MQWHTFLYARKSTEEDDRQILSLDAQEKECRAFAVRQGISISEIIRESHSARKPGRPLFEAMLLKTEALRKREIAVRILCHKPDRLLRNLPDWARVNDLLETGIDLAFVTGSYPNNAQGKMMFGVNVLFAKYYVDNLSEEVRKGMKEKVEQGGWPMMAPLGYRNVEGRVETDPDTAPLVRRAFEYFAGGEYTLSTLAGLLYAEGLRGRRRDREIVKSVLRNRILTNPFYCGLLRYRGEFYPGKHEPLVSSALFEQVQTVLAGRTWTKRQRHEFRYGGVFRCGVCQCAVIGDIKKGRYVYYRCSHKRGPCTEGYIRQEILEEGLREKIGKRLYLPREAVNSLRMVAEKIAQEESRGVPQQKNLWERRLVELKRRQTTLLDLRLAGHLEDQEYLEKREEIVRGQREAQEQLSRFELPQTDPQESLNWFFHACNSLGSLLEEGEDGEIRELLRIVGSNYRLRAKKVEFDAQEPFKWVMKSSHRSLWWTKEHEARTFIRELAGYFGRLGIASPK